MPKDLKNSLAQQSSNPEPKPMKLINDFSTCHRLWSVRLALAGAVLNAGAIGWTVFQGAVNPLIYAAINMSLGIGVAVVRVLAQSPPSGDQQ